MKRRPRLPLVLCERSFVLIHGEGVGGSKLVRKKHECVSHLGREAWQGCCNGVRGSRSTRQARSPRSRTVDKPSRTPVISSKPLLTTATSLIYRATHLALGYTHVHRPHTSVLVCVSPRVPSPKRGDELRQRAHWCVSWNKKTTPH